jgi:uncharacterized protein
LPANRGWPIEGRLGGGTVAGIDHGRTAVGPVAQGDRIVELDVLRGVALFGVLTMNFVGFAGAYVLATESQLAALPSARFDEVARFLVEWLIGGKANTMFATLFGLGFYLQMKRGAGRPGFEARYARRLGWLLVFGVLNFTLLWNWDVLHVYALSGFLLLLMRNWSTRTLIAFGAIAALYSFDLHEALLGLVGIPSLVPEGLYTDSAVMARQGVMRSGDYPAAVLMFWQWSWVEWLAGGMLAAWLVYALGRFALGAAIGRSGILDDIPGHLPLLRRVARLTLPSGLVLALASVLLDRNPMGWGEWTGTAGHIMHPFSALVLAAGYSSAIVLAFQGGRGRAFFDLFRPVGQMALTNYLVQGFAYGFVLSGVGPGLGLVGQIGTTAVVAVCIAFFAAQIAFSHWWLARYRFGPMEWLWRWLTYGARPGFHRPPLAA